MGQAFLDQEERSKHSEGQAKLQARLEALISEYGGRSGSTPGKSLPSPEDWLALPKKNIMITEGRLQAVQLQSHLQGPQLVG